MNILASPEPGNGREYRISICRAPDYSTLLGQLSAQTPVQKSPSQGLCSTAEAASFMLANMAGIQNPFKYTILPEQNRWHKPGT